MTTLPETTDRKLGLVIDLDICVGCHACVVSCKEWNTGGYGAPLSDQQPYGDEPVGSFLNRVHTFEVKPENAQARVVHFPKSCLHCEDAPCVTVCPTGASFKRSDDGIVLVNESSCIGCGLCAVRTCPAKARHFGDLNDPKSDVSIMVADRGGFDLMPEQGTKPVNKYLPPRPKQDDLDEPVNLASLAEPKATGFLGWLDDALTRIG